MFAREFFFFFFQAEDGIRDGRVTGVQTCALPISVHGPGPEVTVLAGPSTLGRYARFGQGRAMQSRPTHRLHGITGAWQWQGAWRRRAALAAAVAGLGGGVVARLVGAGGVGRLLLTLTVVVALVPLAVSVGRELVRRMPGVDVIALLALAGALALGEVLAGAVSAVMLAPGRLLEGYAGERARRELSALLRRAPQTAHRYQDQGRQGGLLTCPLEAVRRGDRLL